MNTPATPISANSTPAIADIDALDVSERWKTYFKGIRDLGGLSMPLLKQVPKQESRRLFKQAQPPLSSFALAFVFGFFYYLVKGMWKKGLVLLAIVIPLVVIVSALLYMIGGDTLANVTRFMGGVIFGMMAPRDFYATKVLGDDGWLPVKPW